MKKEKVKSNQLQRLMVLKAGKLDYSEITDEDFDNITDLYLDGLLVNGRPSGITLDLIDLFPNLAELSISNFEIRQEDINRIESLEQLKSIIVSRCFFKDVELSALSGKKISFVGCESLGVKLPQLKAVVVRGSKIDFSCIDLDSATNIIIEESNIYNVKSLKDYPNIRSVNFDGSTLFSNFEDKVSDIEVSDQTTYSHSIDVDLNDPQK